MLREGRDQTLNAGLYAWKGVDVRARHCLRCKHRWFPRAINGKLRAKPLRCPRCQSKKWNTRGSAPG